MNSNFRVVNENECDENNEEAVILEIANTRLYKEEKSPLKDIILNVLGKEDVPVNGLDTLEVARKALGPNSTQKQVNSTLYGLLKENKIFKITVEGKARPH
jgi:hypothetical protein